MMPGAADWHTLFVTTEWIQGDPEGLEHDLGDHDQQPSMSKNDLRDVGRISGITIGSHTVRHSSLAKVGDDELARALTESRTWLEGVLEKPVDHVAIPFGQPEGFPWEKGTKAVSAAGYKTLLSNYGANGTDRVDENHGVQHVRRVPAPNTADPNELAGWVLGLCNLRERRHPVRKLSS